MADLSPVAAAALEAFKTRYELLGPLEDNWIEVCLAASLQALAGHKPPPWTGEGALCHWHPSQKTRLELRNIADELENCAED